MHPEVRVQERMMVRGPRRPVGRGRSVWSEDEEEVVVEFGANHGFTGVYAPLIAAQIPGKSLNQIREKVRTMRRTGRLPHVNFSLGGLKVSAAQLNHSWDFLCRRTVSPWVTPSKLTPPQPTTVAWEKQPAQSAGEIINKNISAFWTTFNPDLDLPTPDDIYPDEDS